MKKQLFDFLSRLNVSLLLEICDFIFLFSGCISIIYTRLRKGAKSFSPCALSTPSLIAMKRTFFCGKIISLIWTRPQNHAELLTTTKHSNKGVMVAQTRNSLVFSWKFI